MGQVIGKAAINPSAVPFVGLPRRAIADLFDAYHSIAESYGITRSEFTEIIALSVGEYLQGPLACSTDTKTKSRWIASLANELFALLDDDENALVDAFEFLSTLVLLSACTAKEKILFVLRLYEFDEPLSLAAEEAILAIRAIVLGLDKVTTKAPETTRTRTGEREDERSLKETQKVVNQLALAAFLPSLGDNAEHDESYDDIVMRLMNSSTTVSKEKFISHIMTCPEIISWIKRVDCGGEQSVGRHADRPNSAADIDGAIKSTETLKLLHSRLSRSDHVGIDNADVDSSLKLDWIYGRNIDACGNGAFHLHEGQVVYPAGNVVVKATYNKDIGVDDDNSSSTDVDATPPIQQEYFTEHSGHVTALAVHTSNVSSCGNDDGSDAICRIHSSDSLVATANIGRDESLSLIKVWSARTMKSIVTIPVPNVCMLNFSQCGELLLAVAFNSDHDQMNTVTVCKWRDRKILYSCTSTRRPVYDCSFLAGGRFGLAGDGFVHFWRPRGDVYERQIGVFGQVKSSEIMTCISCVSKLTEVGQGDGDDSLTVTGSAGGNLCVWEGRCCVQCSPVGTCGSITRLYAPSRSNGGEDTCTTSGIVLCVGTSDGRIHLFAKAMSFDFASNSIDNVLELRMSLSVASLTISRNSPLNNYFCIDSLCLAPRNDNTGNEEKTKLLVGLRNSALFEMDVESGRVTRGITQCHGDGKSTSSHMSASTDDGGQYKGTDIIARLSGLALNPNDDDELVTTGSADGLLCQWKVSLRVAKRSIVLDTPASCVCYSSDGSRIYVGFADATTEKSGAYAVLCAKDMTVLGGNRHSQQELTDCKSSLDGRYYAFASKDSNIYVYDAHTNLLLHKLRGHNDAVIKLSFGQAPSSEHRQKEVQNENTTTISSLITTIEPPPPTFLRSTGSSGEVLFWNVVSGKKCTYSSQKKTVWDAGSRAHQRYMHTVGTDEIDCCLFQWRVVEIDEDGDFLRANTIGPPLLPPNKLMAAASTGQSADTLQQRSDTNIIAASACSGGTPQWRRVMVPPSNSTDRSTATIDRDLPRSELELEFVQGSSVGTAGSRSLFYAKNDDGTSLIYPVGRTLVRSNQNSSCSRSKGQRTSEQIFHQECSGKIGNVAGHPSLPLCAVSHAGDDVPAIHIVDYRQRRRMMDSVQIFHLQSPCKSNCLRFDESGQYLVAICQGEAGTEALQIIDWKSNACIASVSATASNQQTKDVAFLPDGSGLIQCGAHVLTFWSWSGGGSLDAVPLNLGGSSSASGSRSSTGPTDGIYHSIGFIGNQSVVGTDDGCLLLFNHHTLDATIKAHSSAVLAISLSISKVASGCSDGVIKIWDSGGHKAMCCIASFDVTSLGVAASVRSAITNLCLDSESERLLFGTAFNEIWEVQLPISSSSSTSMRSSGEEDATFSHANIQANIIVQGHYGNQSIGLSINPRMATYATVAGDSRLRVWSVDSHRLLRSTPIEMAARACAHSPDGAYIVIGFGAERKRSAAELHGKLSFFRERDLGIEFELRDARKMISEIKWSNDGEMLAVGSLDACIYLYSIRVGHNDPNIHTDLRADVTSSSSLPSRLSATLVRKIDGAFSSISSINFSADGNYIQATCASNTLAWFDTTNGSPVLEPSSVRDVIWATQTATVGWGLQGLWDSTTTSSSCDCRRECHGGSVDPSRSCKDCEKPPPKPIPTTVDCTLNPALTGCEIVASGDTAGKISLRRYPSVPPTTAKGSCKVFGAHCGPIAKARFVGNASHLITVGEVDQAVMIWRHFIDEGQQHEESKDEVQRNKEVYSLSPKVAPTDGASLSVDARKRVWMRSCIEPPSPDNFNAKDEIPATHLNLTFVHGLSSAKCFASYNCNGNVVYSASRIGVVYDKDACGQRFFKGHRGDITAFATSSANSGQLVVTGDDAHRPTVRVWGGDTCQELCCLEPAFTSSHQNHCRRQITFVLVDFSSDEKSILAVGRDRAVIDDTACTTETSSNVLFLWTSFSGQWKRDVVLRATANCGSEHIDFAFFCCKQKRPSVGLGLESAAETKFDIVTGGRNHINLWARQGSHLSQTRGVFLSAEDVQAMHCGASIGGNFFLTGAENGNVYFWKGSIVISSFEAHAPHRVNCIQVTACQRFLATGGNDGFVKVWRVETRPTSDEIEDLSSLLAVQASVAVGSPVRSIAIDPHLFHPSLGIRRLLIATDAGKLCEVSAESGNLLTIQGGHKSSSTIDAGLRELWGLATHPTNGDEYFTVGDDGVLRSWSINDQKQTNEVSLGLPARAVCVSSDGKTILIGCGNGLDSLHRTNRPRKLNDGTFLIVDGTTLHVLFRRQDTSAWIREAAFSPNDELFALAAADKKIYIYENDASKRYRLKYIVHSHTAQITSLDFSSDGFWLQSTSSEGELLVHNTECGELMALPSQLKSIKWSTWTSTYGWPMQGLWPKTKEAGGGSCVNNCSAHDEPLAVDRSRDGRYLVACSSSGRVELLHYPVPTRPKDLIVSNCATGMNMDCLDADIDTRCRLGHSPGRIARCRFSCDGKHVITIGREDCTVMVWSVE